MKALHQPDPMGTAKRMNNYFLYMFLKKPLLTTIREIGPFMTSPGNPTFCGVGERRGGGTWVMQQQQQPHAASVPQWVK